MKSHVPFFMVESVVYSKEHNYVIIVSQFKGGIALLLLNRKKIIIKFWKNIY